MKKHATYQPKTAKLQSWLQLKCSVNSFILILHHSPNRIALKGKINSKFDWWLLAVISIIILLLVFLLTY